jgi:hypothetical protein
MHLKTANIKSKSFNIMPDNCCEFLRALSMNPLFSGELMTDFSSAAAKEDVNETISNNGR